MKEVYYLKQFLKRHFPFGSVSPYIIIIASNICPVRASNREILHMWTRVNMETGSVNTLKVNCFHFLVYSGYFFLVQISSTVLNNYFLLYRLRSS